MGGSHYETITINEVFMFSFVDFQHLKKIRFDAIFWNFHPKPCPGSCEFPQKCGPNKFWRFLGAVVVVVFINTIKVILDLNRLFLPSFQTGETHQHGNKQKLPINSFTWFIFLLVLKKLVGNLTSNRKVVIIVSIITPSAVQTDK